MFAAIFGAIGSIFKGIFGLKKAQGQALQNALKVVSDINASQGQREHAIATIIAAESGSGFWLAAVWRPLTAVTLLALVICSFFGFVPAQLNADMSPMMQQIFDLLKICIMGYIPARTIDKIAAQMNIGKILKAFIEKKVL